MFYCLVVGSRNFDNYDLLETMLDNLLIDQHDIAIVSGGAKGADSLAERYALEKDCTCIVFKANWKQYGRSAGIKRNEEMQQYIAQFENRCCIAFWDGQSKGTQSNFKLAEKYGNRLHIVRWSVL